MAMGWELGGSNGSDWGMNTWDWPFKSTWLSERAGREGGSEHANNTIGSRRDEDAGASASHSSQSSHAT